MNTVLAAVTLIALVGVIAGLLVMLFVQERTHRLERATIMRALLARNGPEFAFLQRTAPDPAESDGPGPARRLRPPRNDEKEPLLPEGLS